MCYKCGEKILEDIEKVKARAAFVAQSKTVMKKSRPKLERPLVWCDLEMTGLDISKEVIIEIAVIVTDGKLETQIKGPSLVIGCDEALL